MCSGLSGLKAARMADVRDFTAYPSILRWVPNFCPSSLNSIEHSLGTPMIMLRTFLFLALIILVTDSTPALAGKDPWRLELRSEATCEFTLWHVEKNSKLKFSSKFEFCDSVLEISRYTVSNKIAIIDAPSERGGSAYIVHAHGGAMKTLNISYQGTDEDSLEFRLQGNNLKLYTTAEEINLVIAADGSIKIKSRK
jgi:hypothetical protein